MSGITLDVLTRRAEIRLEDRVVLVDITESDYGDIFGRKRPLDPLIILKLIQAALRGGAKLVAVDIATEDWPQRKDIDAALANVGGLNGELLIDGGAVVWARDFYMKPEQLGARYEMQPIIGGAAAAATECFGPPGLAEEAGVVRWFTTSLEADSSYQPSFVEQILYRSTHNSCLDRSDNSELRLISFSSKIRSESAGTLLQESEEKDWGVSVKPYARKVVILGGSFHAGADLRGTPMGVRSGLEINGQAVASALKGEARLEIGEGWSLAADIGLGILVVFIGLIGPRAHLWTTALTLLIATSGMWLLWREYYLFLSFIPIGFGLIAHLYLARLFPHGSSDLLNPARVSAAAKDQPALGKTRRH